MLEGTEYHKIQSIFKRDPKTKNFLGGEWTHDAFEYLRGAQWEATEKVDGTNIRLAWDGQKVHIGGRTARAQIPATLLEALDELIDPAKWQEVFGEGPAVVYGEGYGAKIQKGGGNYRPDQSFVIFDVKVGEWWLHSDNVQDIASSLGIGAVPVIGYFTLDEAVFLCEKGFNSQWGDFEAEGVILKPSIQLFDRQGKRIITKIKCKDFHHLRQEAAGA